MLRKLILFLLAITLAFSCIASADTGTYVINHQYTDLTIINGSSDVLITYDVDFAVTGGNIPWVTCGMPTSNYDIVNHSGAIKSIYPYNSGGWTGVRMDLDRTYYPGESFTYKFSAIQHNFVFPSNGRASIQITPNWWDNAVINDMQITYHIMFDTNDTLVSDTQALFNNDNTIAWKYANVPDGTRHTVAITLPLAAFPELPATTTAVPSNSPTNMVGSFLIFIIIGGIILAVLVIAISGVMRSSTSSSDDYEAPKLFLNTGLSGKKITRNMQPVCPEDDSKLDDAVVGGVTAAICFTCGGLFFDRGIIEKFMKNNIKESAFNPKKLTFAEHLKSAFKAICPRCNGKLEEHTKTNEGVTGTLHFCADCGGIWCTHGQYDNILNIFNSQKKSFEKAGKSNEDVDKNSWFFYPYIYYPVMFSHASSPASYSGGHYGGAGASTCVSHSSCVAHSSCVSSCACVASCACACACAGGGAAGCSPKTKFNQIHLYDVKED